MRDRIDIGAVVVAVEPVQVDRRRHHLAARQPPQARLRCLPAGSRGREPLSRSAHSSSGSWLPPTIGGAGCAQRRGGRDRPAATQRSSAAFGKQPAAGDLGAGHGAVGDQLVELALATAADRWRPRRWSASSGIMHMPAHICIWFRNLTDFEPNASICAEIAMPDNASALQLVLSGDPALFAIVRLSLLVSLSAVVLRGADRPAARRAARADALSRPRGRHRRRSTR